MPNRPLKTNEPIASGKDPRRAVKGQRDLLAVAGREKYGTRVDPLMPGVEFVAYGDTAASFAAIDDETAAFIVEPIVLTSGAEVKGVTKSISPNSRDIRLSGRRSIRQ